MPSLRSPAKSPLSAAVVRHSVFNRWTLIASCIVLTAIALTAVVRSKCRQDYETALEHYRQGCAESTKRDANRVAQGFGQIYQNIRTIGFLPSVRTIDRHGESLTADGKQAIQQIYNNLANSVAVSEVYIVPVDFDPERLDPKTGKNEEPILMFDTNEYAEVEPEEEAEGEEHEEIEIEEYRLLAKQIAWLKSRYGKLTNVKGIQVPMVCGYEVITCDNAEYNKTLRDDDRKGVMLSVPFYDLDGQMRGVISAVVRTNLLRSMMPDSHCALLNRGYGLTIQPKQAGQEVVSATAVRNGKPDSSLVFSAISPVEIPDPWSGRELWTGRPAAEFHARADVIAMRQFQWGAYLVIVLIAGLASVVCWIIRRNSRILAVVELDKKQGMIEMADHFESSVKLVTDAIAENTRRLQKSAQRMASLITTSSERAVNVASESQRASSNIQSIATAVEQMSVACREISTRSAESSSVVLDAVQKVTQAEASSKTLEVVNKQIGEIIVLIRNIAGQIKLLSLNAAIEASRAGAAGSGFAVVAHEVKVLANETSDAANQVADQIHGVQTVAYQIVDTFTAIRRSIDTVESSSTTIASAIEEQTATTSEISSSVTSFATGTSHITTDIDQVMQASREADTAAKEVMTVVSDLAEHSDQLKTEISRFLADVRPT